MSKLQIQINLLDFSFQRHKFKYIFKINFLDFSCQNCKYKSIYWIFLVKDTNSNIFSWYITNLDISYYFSCQNLNLNECDGFFLSKILQVWSNYAMRLQKAVNESWIVPPRHLSNLCLRTYANYSYPDLGKQKSFITNFLHFFYTALSVNFLIIC